LLPAYLRLTIIKNDRIKISKSGAPAQQNSEGVKALREGALFCFDLSLPVF
jgi:hypothetical protein